MASPRQLEAWRDFAVEIAQEAGAIACARFRAPHLLERQSKTDASPVTIVDRNTERALRTRIEAAWPEHGILGEEFPVKDTTGAYVWVLDPIDGTKGFSAGTHGFGTLIALCEHGAPIVGVIHQPITGDLWAGAQGMPTTLNGAPVRCAKDMAIGDAILMTSDVIHFDAVTLPRFEALSGRCSFRVLGQDCIAFGLLACGTVGYAIEPDLKPYDILAMPPIVLGAGGSISDWRGEPLSLSNYAQALASANGALHAQALEMLR